MTVFSVFLTQHQRKLRIWATPFVIIFYTLLFYFLFSLYGRGIGAVAIFPVLFFGWFFGWKAGMLSAALSFVYNMMLVHIWGAEAMISLLREGGGPAGTLALVFIGGVIGRLAELSRRARQDLKDRVAAEEEARATKEFLENIIESSLDAIVVTDEQGYIARANQALFDMLGYSEKEITGKSMDDFFIPKAGTYRSSTGKDVCIEEHSLSEASLKIDFFLKTGRVSNWENYYRNRAGNIIPVEQNMVILKDKHGNRIGSVGIIRDITERRKAEEALRETSRTLLSLIEESPVAIAVFDAANTVSIWNPAAERIFGWTRAEVVGRKLPLVAADAPDELSSLLQRVRKGESLTEEVLKLRRRDDSLIDISVSSAPLTDELGNVYALMTLLSDITEQKRLQQEILSVSGREQRRIGQDLHDGLGQVLTGVAFMGRALGQKLKARQLPEAEEAEEITRLVNSAISHTRSLARGLYPATLESEGLSAALEELAAATENLFSITCEFSGCEHLETTSTIAAVHLFRIAQEAVNNAVRHGKPTRIQITIEKHDDRYALSISDNGTGIRDATQAKGMGINLMKYRAKIIGAKLFIDGKAHQGTKVTCSFRRESIFADRQEAV